MATTLLAAITTAVVVVALVTVSGGSADEQPGIRVAVTSKGFNFVCYRAIYLLKEYLATLSIPDIHGKAKVKILFFNVKIDYTISDLKLYNVEIPNCSIDTGSSGLTLTTTEISAKVNAHIKVKHSTWPHLHVSTDTEIDFQKVSFSLVVYIDRDTTNNHVTLTIKACSVKISKVTVSFKGAHSKILDLLRDLFEDLIKSRLPPLVCGKVTRVIDKKGEALKSKPLILKLDGLIQLDYSLTQSPEYTASYMAAFFKGEFQPVGRSLIDPLKPRPLPPIQVGENMLYVWVTDYTLNTAGFALQKNGQLEYTLTPDRIPKSVPFKLNTRTFQPLVPSLSKHYPNMAMELAFASTKPPKIKTTQNRGTLSNSGTIQFNVILPNNTVTTAFILSFNLRTDFSLDFKPGGGKFIAAVTFNLSSVNANFHLKSSNIGNFNPTSLTDTIRTLIDIAVVPAINHRGNKGVNIPSVGGIYMSNPNFSFNNGYSFLTTDFKMRKDER